MNNGILKLEINKPQTISLKYPTGTPCNGFNGTELRWILMDGRMLYTPTSIGDKLKSMNIKAGQSFTIIRAKVGRDIEWTVTRSGQPVTELLDTQEDIRGQDYKRVQPIRKLAGSSLEEALKIAVSAAAEAEKHGKGIGYPIQFSSGDIRAMGISVLISMGQGRRNAA